MLKLAKLLNEQTGDWDFTTDKVDVDAYGFEKYSEFPGWESWEFSKSCIVKWSVDFEVRSYGIKDILPMVRSIAEIFVSNDIDDTQQQQIEISEKAGWKITVGYFKSEYAPSLRPIAVELYFKVKEAKVIFQS